MHWLRHPGLRSRFTTMVSLLAIFCSLIASTSLSGISRAGSGNPSQEEPEIHGLDLANLDRNYSPCDDFYHFADGGWMASHPIPAAFGSWGSFNVLAEKNYEKLRHILEIAASANAAPGSNARKIGDFYFCGMQEKKIEAEGYTALAPELERIEAVKSQQDLKAVIAHLQSEGINAVFRFGSALDFKDSSSQIAFAAQGGLGMPDRDYYLKDDPHSVELRDQYTKHVAAMLGLVSEDASKADGDAKTVMSIETGLAKASMTRVQTRNPDLIYHKMGPDQLKELTPDFSWSEYFSEIGLHDAGQVNVAQPDFFKQVDADIASIPLADWRVYLRWRLIDTTAPYLSSAFVQEDFNFNGKVMTGAEEIQPRWRRVVAVVDRDLGEALGQEYVKQYFPPEAKAAAVKMVDNLIQALRGDIKTLDWMGPETRQQALAKLDAITKKIGYPDKWIDYSSLKIDRGSYVMNQLRSRTFEFNRQIQKIGKPVDRGEWGMTPPTVNAYYNPTRNEIVFPAGILQPPFYDPEADDAINYGGIGAVIGHEMTHGFDDSGSKFDAKGNLSNWWSPEDLKNFHERTQCIIKQFDAFTVQNDLHENGKLVAGESIADLGGLTIAYKAFRKSLGNKTRPQKIDGFTPEQRFFLGWAQVWAANQRPQFERLRINTDPHPLPRFRATAPLSNMPEFASAFGCKEPSRMIRPASERCRIW